MLEYGCEHHVIIVRKAHLFVVQPCQSKTTRDERWIMCSP